MSNFLNNLKNAVEKGEFNSDAAKKINEINELADKKINLDEVAENVKKKVEEDRSKIQPVEKEVAEAGNLEYENKMNTLKESDQVNSELATLIDVDGMIQLSINDMLEHMKSLEEKYSDKINDDNYKPLFDKIKEIRDKYV